MLTREQLLKNNKLPVEKVKAFGGTAYVKTLNGRESIDLQKWFKATDTDDMTSYEIQADLLCRTLCDEDGNPLFDDPKQLDDLNPHDVAKCYQIAVRINTIREEDIKEAEKN